MSLKRLTASHGSAARILGLERSSAADSASLGPAGGGGHGVGADDSGQVRATAAWRVCHACMTHAWLLPRQQLQMYATFLEDRRWPAKRLRPSKGPQSPLPGLQLGMPVKM